MTDFQLIVLAIILYSIATTFYIIFLTWQLHKSRQNMRRILSCYECMVCRICFKRYNGKGG